MFIFPWNFFVAIAAVELYDISERDYHANQNLYYYFMGIDEVAAEAHRNAYQHAMRNKYNARLLITEILGVQPWTLIKD